MKYLPRAVAFGKLQAMVEARRWSGRSSADRQLRVNSVQMCTN